MMVLIRLRISFPFILSERETKKRFYNGNLFKPCFGVVEGVACVVAGTVWEGAVSWLIRVLFWLV